jgi:hypothetical protein
MSQNKDTQAGPLVVRKMAIKYENRLNESLDRIPDTIRKVQLLIDLIGKVEDETR